MYKLLIKPIFFLFDPEKIHHKVFATLKVLFAIPLIPQLTAALYKVRDKKLETKVAGLTFPSPVGLAAGFDKNALLYNHFENFGFGFVEVGTVTPKGQEGNPKPRIFRLPEDEALINRMGFNNDGMDVVTERLKNRKSNIIVGGNIGKNKVTPNEQAVDDYEKCFLTLYPYVDYFVLNVSSPNTPGLRDLQEKEPLKKMINHLMGLRSKQEQEKPIFLKIAPDLTMPQLDDIIEIVEETKLDGVIATNTTISRSFLKTDEDKVKNIGAGGLSGKPLLDHSTEILRYLSARLPKKTALIGVGGIHNAEDAIAKLNAGADLVQVYTGFVYEGPGLVKRINKSVLKQRRHG